MCDLGREPSASQKALGINEAERRDLQKGTNGIMSALHRVKDLPPSKSMTFYTENKKETKINCVRGHTCSRMLAPFESSLVAFGNLRN